MQSSAAASALQQQRLASAAAASRRPASRRAPAAPARAYYQQPAGSGAKRAGSAAGTEDVSDIIHLAKRRLTTRAAEPAGPFGDFMRKVNLAWRIFFPEPEKVMTPKEEGKQRLRMILVADRVGMNEVTMEAMRERIIGAVSPYVEIESPDLVEVAVTTDVDLGAIYSVAVPVRRVKPEARVPLGADGEFQFQWDPTDEEADPSAHFPYGT